MSIQLLTRTSPASLRDGARILNGSAGDLDAAASAMDGEARGLIGTDWEGNAAEAFRGTWTEYHRPQLLMIGMLRESGEVMDQLAADLERAQEQFRAAQAAAAAAGVTIDMTTGTAAPPLAFTDPADTAAQTETADDLRRVNYLVSDAIQEAQRADEHAAQRFGEIQRTYMPQLAERLKQLNLTQEGYAAFGGAFINVARGLEKRHNDMAGRLANRTDEMRALRGKPAQRDAILAAMRQRERVASTATDVQRAQRLANHPAFRLARSTVGRAKIPVLSIASVPLGYITNKAEGDTDARAGIRAVSSAAGGFAGGWAGGAIVFAGAAVLGAPVSVPLIAVATGIGLVTSLAGSSYGDKAGKWIHDKGRGFVEDADRMADHLASGAKDAWNDLFG